jgi:hypothetical protein
MRFSRMNKEAASIVHPNSRDAGGQYTRWGAGVMVAASNPYSLDYSTKVGRMSRSRTYIFSRSQPSAQGLAFILGSCALALTRGSMTLRLAPAALIRRSALSPTLGTKDQEATKR